MLFHQSEPRVCPECGQLREPDEWTLVKSWCDECEDRWRDQEEAMMVMELGERVSQLGS